MARYCVDCGKDISYRGNRAIRCEECQIIYRRYMKKKIGSARASKELYQLYKLYLTLTPEELQALFAITKKQFNDITDKTTWRFLRTKLKLINNAYKEVLYGDTEAA